MAGTIKSKGSPATKCIAYKSMADDWLLIRDLMGGTRVMQDAGTRWLPQWPKESGSRYGIRVGESILFNGHRRTIETLTGKVFREPIAVNEDVPDSTKPLLENVDLTGRDLDTFCHAWFKDGLSLGLSHVLVDKSTAEAGTNAEAKAAGIRPYWNHIPAENLIFWRLMLIGGRNILVEIRILETTLEPDGEWAEKPVERIRRLQLQQLDERSEPVVVWSLYRKTERASGENVDGWIIEDTGITEMPEIPLVTFYSGRISMMFARPPLLDQAWLNLSHWRSSSLQRHVLNLGRRPALYFLGFNEEEISSVEIGPYSGIVSSNTNAKVGFAEIEGASIAAGRQELQDIKEEMAVHGVDMLVKKPAQQTAEESRNKQIDSDSQLGAIANNHEDAINNALRFTAMLNGETEGGSVSVPSTFGIDSGTTQEINAIIKSREMRQITWSLFMNSLKDKGVIAKDWDLEVEYETLANEPPEI